MAESMQLSTIIDDKKFAWNAKVLENNEEIVFTLSQESLEELDGNRDFLQKPISALGGDSFDEKNFEKLKRDIDIYREQYLENGYGIGVIRGIDPNQFTLAEQQSIYWIICNFLGKPLVQNHNDEIFVKVEDLGTSMKEGGRYHETRDGGNLHSDSPQYLNAPDYLGLLCFHPAKSGGESILVSTYTIHNEFLKRAPELLDVLYQPFHISKMKNYNEGQSPTTFAPLFTYDGFELTFRYLYTYILVGHEEMNQPLTQQQVAALDLLNEFLGHRENQFRMNFASRDMQFINNRRICHGREMYEDFSEPEKKRILLRAWVRKEENE